ncbi:MAG: VacJ family lipoprotein [Proteobacteria bacterium]|nr:VacJ family lipoprotein [Pseudomonadota bacterium]
MRKNLLGLMLLATVSAAPLVAHSAEVSAVGIDIRGSRPEDIKTVAADDPAENVNRGTYDFNVGLDKATLRPIAKGYKKVVPEYARDRVDNFLTNLSEPVSMLNSIAQGDFDQSFVTFWRFIINTTFGIGGLFDQAQYAGLERREEGFDQTLGSYGVGEGPYVMLPVFGPSSARGVVGKVVDAVTNPFNYAAMPVTLARTGSDAVNARTKNLDLIEDIEATSFDPYATIRSAYIQNTEKNVQEGRGDLPLVFRKDFNKSTNAGKKDFSHSGVLAEQKAEVKAKEAPKKAAAKKVVKKAPAKAKTEVKKEVKTEANTETKTQNTEVKKEQ